MKNTEIEKITTVSDSQPVSASEISDYTSKILNNSNVNVNTYASAPVETANVTPGGITKYSDVSNKDVEAVNYMSDRGYMVGVGDNTFNPDGKVTRAQMAQVLYAMAGKPQVTGKSQFSDVSSTAWYNDATAWAQQNGIIAGYEDGTFRPDQEITNEQALAMLRQYGTYRHLDTNSHTSLSQDTYSDLGSVSPWAMGTMEWAVDNWLIKGNKLNPQGSLTRAELANYVKEFETTYGNNLGLIPIKPINSVSDNAAQIYNYGNTVPSNANVGVTEVPVSGTTSGLPRGVEELSPTDETTVINSGGTGLSALPNGVAEVPADGTTGLPTGVTEVPASGTSSGLPRGVEEVMPDGQTSNLPAGVTEIPADGTSTTQPSQTVTTKFTDVKASDAEAVNYVAERGLMVGTGENTFDPNSGITRGQIVQILYSMSGSPSNVGGKTSFSDVNSGDWYANAVAWAQNTQLVAGYDDGTFRPNQVISEEQAAAILRRYAEQSGEDLTTYREIANTVNYSSLNGTDQVSNYAQDAMRWAVANGMIDTSSGSIDPKGNLTRAEFAKYLMVYDKNYNGGTGKGKYNITPIQNPGLASSVAQTVNNAGSSTSLKSVNEVAQEVINGAWGNGDERRQRLEAAGYDYSAVQAAVNSQFASTPTYNPTPGNPGNPGNPTPGNPGNPGNPTPGKDGSDSAGNSDSTMTRRNTNVDERTGTNRPSQAIINASNKDNSSKGYGATGARSSSVEAYVERGKYSGGMTAAEAMAKAREKYKQEQQKKADAKNAGAKAQMNRLMY